MFGRQICPAAILWMDCGCKNKMLVPKQLANTHISMQKWTPNGVGGMLTQREPRHKWKAAKWDGEGARGGSGGAGGHKIL